MLAAMRSDAAVTGLAGDLDIARKAVVRIQAHGRLHLGFLDPSGTLGRRFGSLGLMVEDCSTVVELGPARVERASATDAAGEDQLPRARAHVDALRRATGYEEPLHLHIARALPAHAGLGSGTQLALAVGRAFCAFTETALTTSEIARLTGRGQRSGVGIAGFDRGGLLLDGGPCNDGSPAPLLSRIAFPSAWRVLLAFDPRAPGLSGAAEKAALATLPPLPRAISAEICHEVLMRILPGAAAGDFEPFAAGLSRMQKLLGAHFAPAQHGRMFSSAAVGRLLEWIAGRAVAATGQSSWGPTGFAIVPSSAHAAAITAAARAAGVVDDSLALRVVAVRDRGAAVTRLDGG
jgi:beta-RFAP synthase